MLEKKNHLLPNKFSLINEMDHSKKIFDIITKFKIDKIIAFDIISASQCFRIKKRKIVWLGDLRFQTNFYNYLMDLKSNFYLIRHLFYIIYQNYLLKKKYFEYLKDIDRIVVSSKSSEKQLMKIGINSIFLPYPWPKLFKLSEKYKKKIPEFLFFGNLSGLGSKSAIFELFNRIYPIILEKMGEKKFKINIAGSNYERSYLRKINLEKFPEVKFYGFVDKLDSLFSNSIAIIFPGNIPVGNRCRLISCMAIGLPIIADESCKAGNPYLEDSQTALLAKSPEEFVKKMLLCVDNNMLRNELILNAKKLYNKYYSPKNAGKIFEKFINE